MIIYLALPLLARSSAVYPGMVTGLSALFPYLTLLRVEIARFTLPLREDSSLWL